MPHAGLADAVGTATFAVALGLAAGSPANAGDDEEHQR
jgi:hypothetical protein